ncbi:MAG TPA: CbiX/SirB N-terminal domain-containing protein [Pirellulaceae bacterium]
METDRYPMNEPAEKGLLAALSKLDLSPEQLGIVVVDHGSRIEESNRRLGEVVSLFQKVTSWQNIEAAHMELAEPSIATAFARCVVAGAEWVVVHPFFLLPGRHWTEDIPRLARAAARPFPQVRHLVSAPLGAHELIARLMHLRVSTCLEHAAGLRSDCDLCHGDRCGPESSSTTC